MLGHKAHQLLRGEMRLYSEEGRQSTKLKRVKALRDGSNKDAPNTYLHNTDKENLALQFVRDFLGQLLNIQPNRKDLMLTAKNEYDVSKMVCTTIRPTQLGYKGLYDHQDCADLVANYFIYEPLEHATRVPSCLPSPTQVLSWSAGDSFDLSLVLVSLLLGAGYDAYVVHGYAPAWVTLRDQTHTECPQITLPDQEVIKKAVPAPANTAAPVKEVLNTTFRNNEGLTTEEGSHAKRRPYELREKVQCESKYLKELDEANRRGPPPLDPLQEAERDIMADLQEVEATDPLRGKRVHAWVLVNAGRRDVADPFFIEPSTGTVYSILSAPYHRIEAVWSHHNYWVNMTPATPVGALSFDLTNADVWEYVFIDPFNMPPKANIGQDQAQDLGFDEVDLANRMAQDARKMELNENILDVPPSWVSRINISKDQLRLKYPPNGGRTTLYHKAKLERFAENVHAEGLVLRMTCYRDRASTIVRERREDFKNRVDKLYLRIHDPLERKVQECFAPGRTGSLKEWTECLGKGRVLQYYVSARLDGLASRDEQMGYKIVERFEGRPDFLIYRSVRLISDYGHNKSSYTLQEAGPGGDLGVAKMTEKFARNATRNAHDDVAKRTYYVIEGRIRTVYHYDDPRVTRSASITFKDRTQAATNVAGDEVLDLEEDTLTQVLACEKECFTSLRQSQIEMVKLLERRAKEEQNIKLEPPIYERVWERTGGVPPKEEDAGREDTTDHRRVDYLTPFLANVRDPNAMSKDEARHVRDSCLKALKERLLERANIIQTRLNDENAALSKLQANFQRSQQTSDENLEEYGRKCAEAMFRIQILESRLQTQSDSAVRKYEELSEKLNNDPRLVHALRG